LNISRFLYTIIPLKPAQIFYRIFYALRLKSGLNKDFYNVEVPQVASPLILSKSINSNTSYYEKNKFNFLNLETQFSDKINWNYAEKGKLWTYNLNYFDFLNQPETTKMKGLELIYDFIESCENINYGKDPYPTSLRTINWIKFICFHKINDALINKFLYVQYLRLMKYIEYHLLGNHLLENGFSLLFGAYYFKDDELYKKAEKILIEQLNEQILSDGGHFELSPMYHKIILFRLLDIINLVQNNEWKEKQLLKLFIEKAEIMVGWLEQITFKNGQTPLFNDSTENIAPESKELLDYSNKLGIKTVKKTLNESGYRKFAGERYELIADAGKIGPDYIPGHGHADMLSFELHIDGEPFIVDTGTSTYEIGERRDIERSTSAHNTVTINGKNQSDVWAGFRVGKRAKIDIIEDLEKELTAEHNGYSVKHKRTFRCDFQCIKIKDFLSEKANGTARLHFHPSVKFEIKEECIYSGNVKIKIENVNGVFVEKFEYAPEFNKKIPSNCVIIDFKTDLNIVFEL